MNKEILKHAEEKIIKSIEHLKHEFSSIRAGRANPAVLDKIKVDYYDTPTPINQMAAVSVSEARILVISPWDASTISKIEKAIQASDLGINPSNDGKVIRIAFPPLTQERRKDIVKQIHKLKEEAKIAVRNIRRECNEKLKASLKNHEISEDELKIGEEQSQKLTDKNIKEIDIISEAKEREILEI